MPFSAWTKHEVEEGWCLSCSLKIPQEAIVKEDGRFVAYSHGEYFSPNPAGRTELCHSEK